MTTTHPDRVQWGLACKRALRAAGVSQAQASEQINMPRSTLWRKLTGRSPIYMCDLFEFAVLSGCEAADLLEDAYGIAVRDAGIEGVGEADTL